MGGAVEVNATFYLVETFTSVSVQRPARHIEYGPPLFQIDDMVTIIKDALPGVHNVTTRYTYTWSQL